MAIKAQHQVERTYDQDISAYHGAFSGFKSHCFECVRADLDTLAADGIRLTGAVFQGATSPVEDATGTVAVGINPLLDVDAE